jgi:hypothetical protein
MDGLMDIVPCMGFPDVDDDKIAAPPAIVDEVVEIFSTVALEEASLPTQTIKDMIYAKPSAREEWNMFSATLRETLTWTCQSTTFRI